MRIAFLKCHGSGNDFPLVDARALGLTDAEWAGIARALADRGGPVGGDGLLLLTQGDDRHAFGMRMFNPDGSEAETCLNGLRCVARLGFELTGADSALVRLKTSSAEAARAPELAPGVATVRTRVGPASTALRDVGLRTAAAEAIDATVPELPSGRRFTAVAIPNPHLIAFVDAVDEAELVALGEWCEAGPAALPGRANVSFAEVRGADLFVRTYERGVGLTDSCGSAMASSAFAAGLTGRLAFGKAMRVFNRGGMVIAEAEAPADGGRVTLCGNASFLYAATIPVDPVAATAGVPLVHERRADEAAAWDALVAAIR